MKRTCALLSLATTFSGCMVMVPGHLYPVHGPLSTDTPTPIYDVSLSGVLKSGTMTATLRNGEVCRGNWTAVRQHDPTGGPLAAAWVSVHGSGRFVAWVAGHPARRMR